MEHLRLLVDGFQARTLDERTTGWPLLEFNEALGAAFLYVVIVVVLPRLLHPAGGKQAAAKGAAGDKAGAAGDLRSIRLVYNAAMTLINLYFVLEMLYQASVTTWFGAITPGEQGLGMAKVLYLYYLSKVLEWIDTVIMIVRGAQRQLSFLHVYHHVGTFLVWRFNVAYYPGGEAYPPALFNSFVHVVMYYYYFQSTRGYQPWWKMYLTRLQISQLFSFVVLGAYAMINAAPEHRYIGVINGGFALTLLVLFCQFYFASYGRRASASKHASAPSHSAGAVRRKQE
ncbi:GNS1/SUR4 family protein [Acanthamoeba castellanii str. Neff]|uniref:Elongation of fatty acids protein n=1 Tax=Acanthamoeba castellanii (strain ATCC 30010 / Neff) TaxID=1257118 RepID=L8GZZ6_ACACF|nr:GNS1/SUR4 family protein [Acanthamoeba castellanii str. Neff]ELR18844.1 GNS1/SUR4 family protein [Acanthamoeba castellanii str. Neff]